MKATETAAVNEKVTSVLAACGDITTYTLGLGMILGTLFTILALVLIEFARRRREEQGVKK